MSHGDHVSAIAPGFRSTAHPPTRPSRSPPTPRAASMPCSSTPRCTTPRTAAAVREFRPSRRVQGRLDHGRLPGRGDREDPRSGGPGPRHLRAVRRGRQFRRGRPDPRGDRRPAHLRLCRPRPDARRRKRAGHGHVPRTLQPAPDPRRRERAVPRSAGRGQRPRRKRKIIGAAFIEVFEKHARPSAGRSSWLRARSTPTSSKACPSAAALRSRSRATTMSAACPSA
jgi:hypothetical protein